MKTSHSVVKLQNVCFSYRQREVLHNVDFVVKQKDMVAIVGPNGGVKTTLLHLILGLLKPKHGSVLLFDSEPQTTRDRVGYVPQVLAFDPKFPVSVSDVVGMGMIHERKTIKSEKRKRIVDALKKTDCDSLINRPFSALSGGERQRVLISNALVGNPDLLLLDEPTANVDPKSEHEIYELFKELNQTIPIVFVSHNLNVVSKHVSHVLCVNHTADIHPISDVLESTFTELYGGERAMISHGIHCHVTDPSHVMETPHRGEAGCKCHDSRNS